MFHRHCDSEELRMCVSSFAAAAQVWGRELISRADTVPCDTGPGSVFIRFGGQILPYALVVRHVVGRGVSSREGKVLRYP